MLDRLLRQLAGVAAALGRPGGRSPFERAVRTTATEVRDGERLGVLGQVRATRPLLRASLSGRRCVCWRLVLRDEGRQTELHGDDRGEPFIVETKMGDVLVRSQRATLSLAGDRIFWLGGGDVLTPEMISYCSSRSIDLDDLRGISPSSSNHDRLVRLCFHEGALLERAPVAVIGVARWELDTAGTGAASGYRTVPRRLTIEAPPDGELLISNETAALRRR